MYVGDIEITLREAIFSITIASVLFFFGFQLSGCVEHHVNKSNLRYRQAAQISNNTNEFERAMATDIGDAFVEGHFKALDTVTHEHLGGRWLHIVADYQEYRRHTRTVHYTVTDSKGRTRTKTRKEHYWSWDTYKVDRLHSKAVEYVGIPFSFEKFDYSWVRRHHETVDIGFRKRIEFSCLPTEFDASVFTTLAKNTISNGTTLHPNLSIENLYKLHTDSIMVPLFWTLWVMLMIIAIVLFVVLENRWIED